MTTTLDWDDALSSGNGLPLERDFAISEGFSDDQLLTLRSAYQDLGPDEDGRIGRGKLHDALTSYWLSPEEDEFNVLWDSMDRDQDGLVNFPEFAAGLVRAASA